MKSASFAGQQESFINIKGNSEVIYHVKRVFASIFTARSIFYRKKKGFDASVKIAAVVQKMINSDKSGVMFSVDPVKGENVLIEAVFGQGEGIVSGRINPDSYIVSENFEILDEKVADKKVAIVRDGAGNTKTVELSRDKSTERVLKVYEIKQLAEYAKKLEKHYSYPQDIEFAVEDGNIYILQTRAITTLDKSSGKGEELSGTILTEGMAASPGIGSGVVKLINSIEDLPKIKEGDILVTKMTNPDMVVSMQKAAGIITDDGGATCHAAIVSREMGIPAIVGTNNATQVLKQGMDVTVDGYNGKVFQGKTENKKVEILPVVDTKTKIKVLVDLPDFAERAAKAKSDGIGLIRLEGIIASSGKHPLYYVEHGNLDDYTKVLKDGLQKIAEFFIGKDMWIRTSDIRSDEYANLEGAPKDIEKNPMMGFHGIRFSLKRPELFKAELKAVKELVEKGHKFGLMFPQVIGPEEVVGAKKILGEMNMLGKENLKVGAMIETPAAVVLIDDICKTEIDFISFGTNDLTQFTLAVDRGNADVQYLYDETNWAILKQLSRVIRTCKKYNIETSICGQAGSKKEVVEFLIKQGIDSISVNADVAKEISELVRDLEQGGKKGSESKEESQSKKESLEDVREVNSEELKKKDDSQESLEEVLKEPPVAEVENNSEDSQELGANQEESSESEENQEEHGEESGEDNESQGLEEDKKDEKHDEPILPDKKDETILPEVNTEQKQTQGFGDEEEKEPLETEEAIAEEQEAPEAPEESRKIAEIEEDMENSEDLVENPEDSEDLGIF